VRDEGVYGSTAGEAAGAAQDEHDTQAPVVKGGLRAGKGEAVVGRADDEGTLGEPFGVEGVEDGAYAAIERAGALLEGRHVQSRLGGVGQVGGRHDVVGLFGRAWAEPLAVGLEEADGQEEGPVARTLQEVEGHWHHVVGVIGRDLVRLVVADDVGFLGDVLLADERRPVAELVQGVDDVLTIVV
jgi:hypothetical protein